jgi:hypothetical protein
MQSHANIDVGALTANEIRTRRKTGPTLVTHHAIEHYNDGVTISPYSYGDPPIHQVYTHTDGVQYMSFASLQRTNDTVFQLEGNFSGPGNLCRIDYTFNGVGAPTNFRMASKQESTAGFDASILTFYQPQTELVFFFVACPPLTHASFRLKISDGAIVSYGHWTSTAQEAMPGLKSIGVPIPILAPVLVYSTLTDSKIKITDGTLFVENAETESLVVNDIVVRDKRVSSKALRQYTITEFNDGWIEDRHGEVSLDFGTTHHYYKFAEVEITPNTVLEMDGNFSSEGALCKIRYTLNGTPALSPAPCKIRAQQEFSGVLTTSVETYLETYDPLIFGSRPNPVIYIYVKCPINTQASMNVRADPSVDVVRPPRGRWFTDPYSAQIPYRGALAHTTLTESQVVVDNAETMFGGNLHTPHLYTDDIDAKNVRCTDVDAGGNLKLLGDPSQGKGTVFGFKLEGTNLVASNTVTAQGLVSGGGLSSVGDTQVGGDLRVARDIWMTGDPTLGRANLHTSKIWATGLSTLAAVKCDALITTGYVGICRALPNYALDVLGDINMTGSLKINGVNFVAGGATTTGAINCTTLNATGNVVVETGDTTLGRNLDVVQSTKCHGTLVVLGATTMQNVMSANVDNSSEIKSRYLYVTDTAHAHNLNVDDHIQTYTMNSGNVVSGEYHITNGTGDHRVIDNNTDTFARYAVAEKMTATHVYATQFHSGNNVVISGSNGAFSFISSDGATLANLEIGFVTRNTCPVIQSGRSGAGAWSGTITFPVAFQFTPRVTATMVSASTTTVFLVQTCDLEPGRFSYRKHYQNIGPYYTAWTPASGEEFDWIATTWPQ